MKTKTRGPLLIGAIALATVMLLAVLANLLLRTRMDAQRTQRHDRQSYAMSTTIDQQAYGPNAENAMYQAVIELDEFERQLSLFEEDSDIARINAAAGQGTVLVEVSTADLIHRSLGLSLRSENSFAVTIAPLTLAWGVTGDSPRVVPQSRVEELLELVDDSAVTVVFSEEDGEQYAYVGLQEAGMALDLGGIAKGEACSVVANVYERYGVDSALLSIGGNIYARGTKPDGTPFRIGFRAPVAGTEAYIASFEMTDLVIAVSGGYERYFEEDGETYIHIIDPRTGAPAVSDIVSIGVIHEDGATSDFYSTSLYVLGRDSALAHMENGLTCIMLDEEDNLYVSASLADSFILYEYDSAEYNLIFVEGS